ncbi:E3 ubiquitin-protein ligase RNF14-like isoform X2 [Alosa alosa]|uniref:E3 ubiquitin-protein ligase RNF14-like isoform X2 n=1 Tax=Alosa alosa TaxID=278164 RepID=UPI00201521A0|nr:E3 ubiquitin-protein ligase RNF14-like isoform X2 [Alosa alosa]
MDTAREDELLAMENIFGPDEFHRSETSSGGVMKVCPQLPHDFKLIEKGEINQEYDVKFLPPLVVDFELPATYPDHSSPAFTLSCQWLRHNQLSKICRHLEDIWQTSGGEAVLFSWFQFLREDLLGFLSIHSPWEIPCMEEPQDTDGRDPRVTTTTSIPDTDLLQWLLDHNQKMQQREFEGQSFECGICFFAKYGLECHRFTGCEHIFCKDCISNIFRIAIEEGRVLQFNCPDTDCDSVATSSEVKALVGEELFGRYDQLLLQKTLDCMADVVYCPRANCSSPVVLEPGESWAFCASCAFAFCNRCRQGYHGVNVCPKNTSLGAKAQDIGTLSASSSEYASLPKTVARMRHLWEDYENGTKQRKKLLLERYGRSVFLAGIGDALSGDWIETNTQECPRCSVKIHKTGGCNIMRCAHCSATFCWVCHAIIKPLGDYYRHRIGTCTEETK